MQNAEFPFKIVLCTSLEWITDLNLKSEILNLKLN